MTQNFTNNANINYNEVSTLYYKVFDNVSQLRERLLAVDQELQGIVKDWEVLHKKFPSNIFLFYTKRTLNYKPILSTEAQIVNDTGVDNNLNF